jgi:hypothetical protein
MMADAVLFRDIWPNQSEVRVGTAIGISIYGIGTVFLFGVLIGRGIKNGLLKDCLYVPSLMKYLISESKLKSCNQYYLEEHGNILVCRIVNDEVVLWVRECPCTDLVNILTRMLKAHTTYTFWYKALRYPSHDLMKYDNVFSESDLIPSKLKNFECDSCLLSKSTHKVPKTLQDHVKSKFDVIHSDVHGLLAIQSFGGKRYFVIFIAELS